MDDRFETMTVGELVALDYRTAAVLETFEIDFCCGGRRLLHDASVAAGANPDRVKRAIEELPERRAADGDVSTWSLDRLITQIVSTYHAHAPVGRSPFGTVDNPIHMMEREHAQAGQLLQTLRALTNGYTVPPDGCTTYHAVWRLLDNFDHELRRHIHLENNVLFPKAQERERAQWQS